jgi:ribosome-binding factor A
MSPRSERSRFGKTGRGYQRKDRVSEQLREVLAEALERRDEADLDRVTITGVDCSPDLRNATVYYTILGDEQLEARVTAELASLAPALRTHVARTVRLKYTPALTFAQDTFIERGLRIERLLNELHRDDEGPETSSDDGAEA